MAQEAAAEKDAAENALANAVAVDEQKRDEGKYRSSNPSEADAVAYVIAAVSY